MGAGRIIGDEIRLTKSPPVLHPASTVMLQSDVGGLISFAYFAISDKEFRKLLGGIGSSGC